jgi:hypothetical protein
VAVGYLVIFVIAVERIPGSPSGKDVDHLHH